MDAKKAAAQEALTRLPSGGVIGLGTGSTAHYFIEELAKRGNRSCVATSEATAAHAEKLGIPLASLNDLPQITLTVDGADWVDPQGNLIKGGGGALLREKIVAAASSQLIIIADASKKTDSLIGKTLPLEIVPFGYQVTLRTLQERGYSPKLRTGNDKQFFVTDNGNYVIDMMITPNTPPLPELHSQLLQIPGVIETGLFLEMATEILIGHPDGSVEIMN